MQDYGKGGVLGTATALPATSAFGLILKDMNNPVLLIGFFAISLFCLIILLASISRYVINRRRAI